MAREYTTAHDLFGIPVIEDDDDMDHISEMCSKYMHNPQKLQLLLEAALINWDEFMSNHKHCLAIAFAVMKYFSGQVLLLMGDWRQCPAVVKNAVMSEIVSASMLNSPYWQLVTVKVFSINLRLKKLQYNHAGIVSSSIKQFSLIENSNNTLTC